MRVTSPISTGSTRSNVFADYGESGHERIIGSDSAGGKVQELQVQFASYQLRSDRIVPKVIAVVCAREAKYRLKQSRLRDHLLSLSHLHGRVR